MPVEVRLVTLEPCSTAVVAAATTWADFPSQWKPMLDRVWHFLRNEAPRGLYEGGHNVMLYKDDVPNVEIGVQVSGPFEASRGVQASSLPGGRAAMAVHAGPMDRIGKTHDAVRAWCAANGHRANRPCWEIYGDPDLATGDFAVEVYWSIA